MQATLSWAGGRVRHQGPAAGIVRAGAPAFDGSPLADASTCSRRLHLRARASDDTPLHVADLDGDGEPEVVVDVLHRRRALLHRLTDDPVLHGATYAPAEHTWGSIRLRPEGPRRRRAPRARHGRRRRLRGRLHLARGARSNRRWCSTTTPTRRGLLARRDAAPSRRRRARTSRTRCTSWPVTRRQHAETLGAVAAYVADLYLLGRGREVRPYLARARKRGDLRTAFGQGAAQLRAQAAGLPAQAGLPLAGGRPRSAGRRRRRATTSPWRSGARGASRPRR